VEDVQIIKTNSKLTIKSQKRRVLVGIELPAKRYSKGVTFFGIFENESSANCAKRALTVVYFWLQAAQLW
jgi:hypothetical protein